MNLYVRGFDTSGQSYNFVFVFFTMQLSVNDCCKEGSISHGHLDSEAV